MHLLYARFFVKAMRDMGVFDETETAMMREHGRQPDRLFDEPFMMLRNQGQILGEERLGDHLVIDADRVDGRFVARTVRVDPEADDAAGDVVGELMRRTENTLQVRRGDAVVTVEVPDSAAIEVPDVPGVNDVNQLKHHLEIQRMSKSKGNVVNPDELVVEFGADTVRTYLMFAFEWQKGGPWNSQGIMGSRRFIEDVWKIGTVDYEPTGETEEGSVALRRRLHQTIDRVDNGMHDVQVEHRGGRVDDAAQRHDRCRPHGIGEHVGLGRSGGRDAASCWPRSPLTSPRNCGGYGVMKNRSISRIGPPSTPRSRPRTRSRWSFR